MNKWANVDFQKCDPSACDGQSGVCAAARACTHKMLVQESPGESPMLLSTRLCVGCGTCVPACALGALEIRTG